MLTQATIASKVTESETHVRTCRLRLAAAAANENALAKDLGTKVNELAEAEGALDFWARLALLADRPNVNLEDNIFPLALDILSAGADDTWSGRGNDVARARYDGMTSAAQELRYL